MRPACTVIVVSHNSEDFLGLCLGSVLDASTEVDLQVIVVDNASDMDPETILGPMFPEVQWIKPGTNLGFGRACNLGAQHARNPLLLFVNPDAFVPTQSMLCVLEALQTRADSGLVGCKILNPDGTVQRAGKRAFPTPIAALGRLLRFDKVWPDSRAWGRYNLTYLSDDREATVDAVSGSFFGVRAETYAAVGGFDEDFFMYGEDLDIGFRVQALGYKNWYLPQARVVHVKGHSSQQKPWFTHYHFYLAMWVFARKHRQRLGIPAPLLGLGIWFFFGLAAVNRLLPKGWALAQALLGGVLLQASLGSEWSWGPSVLGWLGMLFLFGPIRSSTRTVLVLALLGMGYGLEGWMGVLASGVALLIPALLALFVISLQPLAVQRRRVFWHLDTPTAQGSVVPMDADVVALSRDSHSWEMRAVEGLKDLALDEYWITIGRYRQNLVQKWSAECPTGAVKRLLVAHRGGFPVELELSLLGCSSGD